MSALGDDEIVELAEMLEFVHDWIDSDLECFADLLDDFCGHGYQLDELRADLARLAMLLGGSPDRFIHKSRP